jgi:lactate dehydrogenase-like 2-hydroxyacid dehydrogenase
MKLKKILCLGFSGSELEDKYWQEIDSIAEERVLATEISNNFDADGLLVKLGAKVGKDSIDKLSNLKYIGMLGTGYGGIDVDYAASKNVVVTNIADYATEAVAEFTFGILIEWCRGLGRGLKLAWDGTYEDDKPGMEIKGKKFGVIGLGDIGMRTAQLAQAFGADVYYWSRNRKEDAEKNGIKYCELEELLTNSDIITLNLALNPKTEGIINSERLKKIKQDAIFINPSPMELIDFDALVDRLKKQDLVFMLDHSDEMTKEQLEQLKPLNTCRVYPAIAYLTREASELKKRIYIDNIQNYLNSKPNNKVN